MGHCGIVVGGHSCSRDTVVYVVTGGKWLSCQVGHCGIVEGAWPLI